MYRSYSSCLGSTPDRLSRTSRAWLEDRLPDAESPACDPSLKLRCRAENRQHIVVVWFHIDWRWMRLVKWEWLLLLLLLLLILLLLLLLLCSRFLYFWFIQHKLPTGCWTNRCWICYLSTFRRINYQTLCTLGCSEYMDVAKELPNTSVERDGG